MLQQVAVVGKLVILHLVKKYAAEMVLDFTLEALDKVADKTETKLDNELVAKVREERAMILQIIKGA